ncbi:MAG: peptidyl-prolyl cis-trans isomerase [Acidobacteriota bacterium]
MLIDTARDLDAPDGVLVELTGEYEKAIAAFEAGSRIEAVRRLEAIAGKAAVKIGDREIGEQEFVEQVRRLQEIYQQQLGDNWDQFKDQINLGEQAVQQLVERQLMLDEAKEAGLVASEAEVRDRILSLGVFTDESGQFVGQESYKRVLRANRTSPQEFEAQLKEELLLEKLRTMMIEGIWVSDPEVDEKIRQEREQATVKAVQLRYERYLSEISVDEASAREYFDGHREDFRRDEERVIRYLVVETNKLRRLLEVDDADLEGYYNEHQDDFREGEQVQASHILIRLGPGAAADEDATAKFKADRVAKLAREGADFLELVSVHSDDPGTKDGGGDLGWFGRDMMPKEFEDAVFGAKPGDLVGPVKSQFGYHIIKVVGYRPDRVRPLDEVIEDVRFQYLENHAASEAEVRAGALAKRVTSERPDSDEAWQMIADEDEAVVLNESPAFGVGETIPGTGSDPAFTERIFEADEGAVGGPRLIPRGWIVWQLKEVRPEGLPDFENARAEVEQNLRRDRAMVLAHERGLALAEAWRAGGDIAALAEENNTTVVDVQAHRRGAAYGALGVMPALDSEVFVADIGDVVGPVTLTDRGVVLAGVEQLTLVDPAEIEEERGVKRRQLMGERADQLMSAIINERRRETSVTVNTQLVAQFAPKG